MSKYSNMSKVAKCGAVDSKFFNDADGFEESVRVKSEKTEEFKNSIREAIIKEPNLIEQRYHNVISVLTELKKEFNI